MEVTPFHQFIDFVQCDDQIMACTRLQERLEREFAQLKQEHAVYTDQFERIKSALRNVRKDIDARELEIAALRQKKNSAEQKMERITNPKEYMSLQSEVAQANTTLEQIEEKIITLWQDLEQAEAAVKSAELAYEQRNVVYVKQETALQAQMQVVREQLDFLQQDCALKSNLVRPDWLAKFQALKTQLANPVVTLQAGGCLGCFNKIPAQVLARLARHELVTCPFCHRILYQV